MLDVLVDRLRAANDAAFATLVGNMTDSFTADVRGKGLKFAYDVWQWFKSSLRTPDSRIVQGYLNRLNKIVYTRDYAPETI